MEGIFFYWFSWIIWIVITFLWEKSLKRTLLSQFLLILIILANHSIYILFFEMNLAFLLLLFLCFYLLNELKFQKLCYFLIISLSNVAFTTGFRLFLIYDPIMEIFHFTWMIALLNFIFFLIIVKENKFRIPLFITGTCLSEIVYSLFLTKFFDLQILGDLQFLDFTAITVFLLMLWNSFEQLSAYLSLLVKKRVQSIGK